MASAKKRLDEKRVLPMGATHFIGLDGNPLEPIPPGVNIRSGKSVQVEFSWEGRRCTESIKGVPTQGAVLAAVSKLQVVLSDIKHNRFQREHHFPNSRHVKTSREKKQEIDTRARRTMKDLFQTFVSARPSHLDRMARSCF